MRITLVAALAILACSGCGGASMEAAPPPPPPPPGGGSVASAPDATGTTPLAQGEMKKNADPADGLPGAPPPPGLGLTGTGEGGGGRGEGIGLGSIGTLGHGAGTGKGQGYGSGGGKQGGKRGTVQGATATSTGGGLTADVIQRVVRHNMSSIQLCYDTALAKAPSLGGKVAVTFTINAQGAVASASPGDTNISDAEMVTCVLAAVKRMSFPPPDSGGTVNVTYPFAFSSDQ
jgi:TonB family protein